MNFFCGHWCGVGLHFCKGHVIESSKCKNCDELINYTVRVSVVVLRFRVTNVSKGTKLFEICCCPGTGIVDFKLIVIHRLCYVLDLS